MKSTVKKLSDTKVEIKVTLDSEDLAKARAKAIEGLAKEVKVEGFRKGKVPTEVAEKFIPENDINAEAINLAVNMTLPTAFISNNQSPLARPEVNVTKYVPGEMAEFVATADVLPEITLADYKNLKVKKEKVTVDEKDINDVLNNLANAYAEKKVAKRKAKLGDEVVIDFVGKKDGVAFDGGTAKDYRLGLGSGQFIPGFEEGIVGHESGDKFDLELTFPAEYGVKDLAGQKTVFEVLLKQVDEVAKAEINDELAKKCGPFKTLDALKKDIAKNLEHQNAHRVEEKFKDDLIHALVAKSKISAPEILISDQMHFIEDDITRNAASQGLSFDDYLKQINKTKEEWSKDAHTIAEERVKASLALQVLAKENKVTVSDEKVEAKLNELRDVYQKSPEAVKSLKDPRVKEDLKNRMIIEETIEFLAKANEK